MFQRRDINIIYWGVLISFVMVKAFIRPWVLENGSSKLLEIFVLSYPNFCEAIVGVFVSTMILMYLSKNRFPERRKLSDQSAYILATALTGVFVVTQETQVHNLGGNNVYDPYDLMFSGVGLLMALLLLLQLKPSLTKPYRSRKLNL